MFLCLRLMTDRESRAAHSTGAIQQRAVVRTVDAPAHKFGDNCKCGPNSHRSGFRNKYRTGRRSGSAPDFGDCPLESSSELSCRLFCDSSSACCSGARGGLQPIWACLIQLKTQECSSERMLSKSSMFQVFIFLKVVKITPQEQVRSAPRSTFPAPVRTFPSSSGLVGFPACPGTPSHNPRGFHAERSSSGSCRSCRALRSFELSAHQTAPPSF